MRPAPAPPRTRPEEAGPAQPAAAPPRTRPEEAARPGPPLPRPEKAARPGPPRPSSEEAGLPPAAPSPPLPCPREVTGCFGIYVHIPFCAHRCWYCDFNAYAGLEQLAPRYLDALRRDAAEALSAPVPLAQRPVVTSIFVGGGTPSLVPAAALVSVLAAIRDAWPLAPNCEVTVECNPESVDAAKLEAYRAGGVTRVSFGVQSLDDRLLAVLGRTHDAATAIRAVRLARGIFEEVNVDLIFGIPGENDETWRATLQEALSLGPSHVSCYALTYEEGTPLAAWRRLGRVVPVPDDDVARRWELADRILEAAGLRRYEISNWGRPCRHNCLYWACGEYLGIGAGAHSHLDGVRSWTVKAPAAYASAVAAGRRPVAGWEVVDAAGRAAEVMFLGLRLREGVDADTFRALTGFDLAARFGAELGRLAALGLLRWDGRRARLTRRGTLLANEVVCAFLSGD